MKNPSTHFSGGLSWRDSRGAKITILAGWAACCSGDRAWAIRAKGHHTTDPTKVTCKACMANIARAFPVEWVLH